MIGLISAGVGAIGSLVSGLSARSKAKKAEKQLLERRDALNKEYAQDKNTDYLDTEAARSTLALLRRQNRRAQEALNNNAVKGGASDEAKVAAAASQNENYANAASRIAGMGTQYKQRLKENYQRRRDSIDDQLTQVQMQKAQAMSDMIGGITGAASGLISAYGMGSGGGSGKNMYDSTRKAEFRGMMNGKTQQVPAADTSKWAQPLSYDGPTPYEKRSL